MAAQYGAALQERLAIEMARMGGLTEDLVAGCPPELLRAWFAAMQAIWTRGADERFEPARAHEGWRTDPSPAQAVQYDLNAVLTAAGPHGDALAMDAALRPLLDDGALRHRFVTTALAVRAWVKAETGVPAEVLNSYLGQQADPARTPSLICSAGRQRRCWASFENLRLRVTSSASALRSMRR